MSTTTIGINRHFYWIRAILFAMTVLLTPTFFAQADEGPGYTYLSGTVVAVVDEQEERLESFSYITQELLVLITNGEKKGETITVMNSNDGSAFRHAKEGDRVVVVRVASTEEDAYYVADIFRIPALIGIVGIFFLITLLVGRLRGVTSLIGLALSIGILALYIVPRILAGDNPLFVTIFGGGMISVLTMYLAHGFSRKTTVALLGTVITILFSGGIATAFIHVASLFGAGSESAFYIQQGTFLDVNLQGLLLGGMIIGTLGVLDDVTITQTETISELFDAKKDMSRSELYMRGMKVGREHIASLVNTLALAYAGAALPLFLLFSLGDSRPAWVILNSEPIAEELVRALVGSIGLICAVPISTALAVWMKKE